MNLNTYFVNLLRFFQILFLPIVIYVPAMAFNQTTGISVNIISLLVCFVCTFYTLLVKRNLKEIFQEYFINFSSQGGIKAVVWTDVIQVILMIGSLVLIVIFGISDIGDVSVIIERNLNSKRFEPPE